MIGAVIGDIAGSKFVKSNRRPLTLNYLQKLKGYFTDDSIQTAAIASALLLSRPDFANLEECTRRELKRLGTLFPNAGYGLGFLHWLRDPELKPYQSFGNGSAMRVSGCAYAAASLVEALDLAFKTAKVSHDHPEGIKGAQAITAAAYLARHGYDKAQIKAYIEEHFYTLDFTIEEIRPTYLFNATCQGTVPQALEAFLESESFEDALLKALSLGGDSDTIGAMCASVAEAYYGVPRCLKEQALAKLDPLLIAILEEFEAVFGTAPVTD